MEYLVEAATPQVSKFLDSLMPSMIEQLGLARSRRAVLIKVTDEIEDGMQGATLNIEIADCYLVLIKQPKRITKASLLEMGTTLAHEMVHVKQMAKGTLKPKNGINFWRGKRYAKNTKYLNMPWEVEAFSKQELIFRRSIQ